MAIHLILNIYTSKVQTVELSNGVVIKNLKIIIPGIRYANYNLKAHSKANYRERLMLFLPLEHEERYFRGTLLLTLCKTVSAR